MQQTLKKNTLPATSITNCEAEQESKMPRNRGPWGYSDRVTYAKLLLSYLMNNLEVNSLFYHHLATLIKKTYQEVSIFHRKMIAQHRRTASIVMHFLKPRLKNPSHQPFLKIPSVSPPNLITLSEDFRQQELKLRQKQQNYLQNLVFAQESLEQYEEDLSDSGQVLDLDDIRFEKQENTNDSFDQDDGNDQGGYEQEDPPFD